MNYNKIIIAIIGVFSFFACENDPFYYQDQARVRMVGPEKWTLGTDSLEFSFAHYSSGIEDTTFQVLLNVMGEAASTDRTVKVGVVADKSTAQSSQYSFPESVTVPAGAFEAILPVTIFRDESIKDAAVRLKIEIKESSDFLVGVVEETDLTIIWSDILTKPVNWNDLEEFFGEYSLVKYRFIIDTLNQGNFDADELSWAQMKNYQIILTDALLEYNEMNPNNPLTDENGKLVTF